MDIIKNIFIDNQHPMISTNGGRRHLWVDIAKCIGIYLMIIAHGPLLAGTVARQVIYSVHMPLFFVLSGVLYSPITLSETIHRDWHRLLIPYFSLNIIGLFLWVISHPSDVNTISIFSRISAMILGLGYSTSHLTPILTPTWFIIALFFIRILMSLTINHIRVACLCSIMATFFLTKMPDTIVPIDSAIMAFPFFCIGYMIKGSFLHIINRKSLFLFLCLLTSLVIVILISYNNGRVDICLAKYGRSLIGFYLGGIIGTFLTVCGAIIVSRINWVIKLTIPITIYSQGTLLVVAFNILVIQAVSMIYHQFDDSISPFEGIILGIIIFYMFYPMIVLCGKLFPQVIGIKRF